MLQQGTNLFGRRGALAAAMPAALLLGWALTTPRCARPSGPDSPIHHSKTSVLMLTLCTLRADHLGSYGYERDVSPNLDRLAAEGFRFERVLAQAPWTRSSVAAMITGMYPRSLNIEDPEHDENYRRLHDSFTTLAEIMRDLGYHTIGITANPNTAAIFNMDQGFDEYEDPGTLWQDEYTKDRVWSSETVSRLFLEHLRGRPAGEKFFAHLVFIDVHMPRNHKLELEPEDRFEVPPPSRRTATDVYDLQVSFLDKNIGRLLDDLKQEGRAENLLVVVNSDHGEGLRNRSWLDRGHGRLVYNSTIWVPWIVHHPDLETAAPSRASMVRQIDMLPTILDLLGIEAEKAVGGLSELAGVSRAPDIRGERSSPEVEASIVRTQFLGADKAAVVTPELKLILNFDHEKRMPSRMFDTKTKKYYYPPQAELYRYTDDPLEREDVYDQDAELADGLRAIYERWEANFPPLVPADELGLSESEAEEQLEALRALGYVGGD